MSINSGTINFNSLVAQFNLSKSTASINQAELQLSSGLRINKTSDDPVGAEISTNLLGSISSNNQAIQNSQNGLSMLQVAEGTVDTLNSNLNRIRELTVEASNDVNNTTQRNAITAEIQARLQENDRLVKSAQFNGQNLLTGSLTNAKFQLSVPTASVTNSLNVSGAFGAATSSALGLLSASLFGSIGDVKFASGSVARQFLTNIDNALNALGNRLTTIGIASDQLQTNVSNLQQVNNSASATSSQIRDTDFASVSSQLSLAQVLQQADISILSQANSNPQQVLQLLKA